ncbi:hypothetical protein AK830_g9929 [Neonectria ditissima]|uniref:Uncharacterized protein n=1 Tax=Neonectria ditissima TaxID=78410 RepID=A0A0P7B7X4_9HYPO|nr:hypothetical protein AK830_g9929 [Neonectria ditissima]
MSVSITRLVLQTGDDSASRTAYTSGYRHDLDQEIKLSMYKKQLRKTGLDRLGGFRSSRAGSISTIAKVHLAVFGCDLLIADTAVDIDDLGFIAKERELLKKLANKLELGSYPEVTEDRDKDTDSSRNIIGSVDALSLQVTGPPNPGAAGFREAELSRS